MNKLGAILVAGTILFLNGSVALASCEQVPYPPPHDGLAPVPPPVPSDSTFTCDVRGEPEGQNEWLDELYRFNLLNCNFSADPQLVEHFQIKVTRNVGTKSLLYDTGLLKAKLIIYHKLADTDDCWEKANGYPCPKHVVSINGNVIGKLAGGGGWSRTDIEFDPRYVKYSNEDNGINNIDIRMDGEYGPSSRQCYHVAIIDNITIAITAPKPIVFVPGLGGTASNNFANWIGELNDRGVPEDHSLAFPDAKLTQFYPGPIRTAIESAKSLYGVCRVGVVCYSKGGVDLRSYIKQCGSDALEYVATVATPHAGYGGTFVELLLRYADTKPFAVAERIRLGVKRLYPPWGAPGVPQLTSKAMARYNKGWSIGRAKLPVYTLGGLIDLDALDPLVLKSVEWMAKAVPDFVWESSQDGTVAYSSANAIPGTAGKRVLAPLGPEHLKYFHTNLDNSVDSRRRVLDSALQRSPLHWSGFPTPDQDVAPASVATIPERVTGIVATMRDTLGAFQFRAWPFRMDELKDHAIVLTGALDSLAWFVVTPAGDTIRANASLPGVAVYADTVLTQLMALVEFTAPDTGQYLLCATASALPAGDVIDLSMIVLGDDLDKTVTVSSNETVWNPDQTPVVTVACPPPTAGSVDTVTVRMAREDGLGRVFQLRDDGSSPDPTAGDGVFVGQCPNPQIPGEYRGQAEWRRSQNGAVIATRQSLLAMTVNTATVQVDGNGPVITVDSDDDGSIDSLKVPIAIACGDTVDARLATWFSDASGRVLPASVEVHLEGGTTAAELVFGGRDLFDEGIQGTVSLDSCAVWRMDQGRSTMPVTWSSLGWGPYASADYQHQSADSLRATSEEAVDVDSDDEIDALELTYTVRVNDYGTYAAKFVLESDSGTVVQISQPTPSLSPGTRSIIAQFNGVCLGRSGVRTWRVDATLVGPDGTSITAAPYETNDYGSATFEGDNDTIVASIADTLINACPAGDRDHLRVHISFPRQCPTSDFDRASCMLKIRSDSDPALRLWSTSDGAGPVNPGGRGYEGAGDTLYTENVDLLTGTADFERSHISGCGRIFLDLIWQGQVIGTTMTAVVHGSDIDPYAIGFCDSHDSLAFVAGAMCCDSDFNGVINIHDYQDLRHHMPYVAYAPQPGSYAQQDSLSIQWNRAYGDSARIELHLLRASTAFDKTIASDIADVGSYKWRVPYSVPPDSEYYVQITHRVVAFGQRMSYGTVNSDRFSVLATAPNHITDLTFAGGRYYGVLSWLEPGQDDTEADEYDVRYNASATITENNFYSSTSIGSVDAPGPEGTPHCVEVSLSQCHNYYWAIKTRLGATWSLRSNVASGSTKCSGYSLPFCGGSGLLAGGGGEEEESFRRHAVGVAAASTAVGAEASGEAPVAREKSLFSGSASRATELCKLPGQVGPLQGKYLVRLRQIGRQSAEVDHLTLGFVDRGSELESYAGSGGVFIGRSEPVEGVQDSDGRALPGLVSAAADSSYLVSKGGQVIVSVGGSDDATALIITARGPVAEAILDSTGIYVQVPDEMKSWHTVAQFHPGREVDTYAVDVGGQTKVRLACFGPYGVIALRKMPNAQKMNPSPVALVSASHSRLGDVARAVSQSGGDFVVLQPGDSLNLAFTSSPVQEGMSREFFLLAEGSYQHLSTELAGASMDELKSEQSWAFGLGAARPNPSSGRVTFAFTMARSGPALLRLYNVAGRLVRTVVRDQQEAGPHEAVWDGTDDNGARSPAGVYFYRLEAGDWSSERKLVVIQR